MNCPLCQNGCTRYSGPLWVCSNVDCFNINGFYPDRETEFPDPIQKTRDPDSPSNGLSGNHSDSLEVDGSPEQTDLGHLPRSPDVPNFQE